jgi:alkylation response protein AidB-like acyl-CoA dehydrogenase
MNPIEPKDAIGHLEAAELLARAEAAAVMIAPRSAEIERGGRLPEDLSGRLARDGFYRMLVPRAYGGLEVHPQVFVDAVERIARADGASAWCVMISATAASCLAYLPADTARAIAATPDLCMAGVFAPRGTAAPEVRDGVEGFRVSGRWPWGSASPNAHFITGGCLVLDAAGQPEKLAGGMPAVRSMVFRRDQVTLLDTWEVSGLEGTGSTDFEVRDVFVPQAWSYSYLTAPTVDAALYRFPRFGMLSLGIAAACVGMAAGAVEALSELAGVKKPDASTKVIAQRPGVQQQVAEARALVRSSRAFIAETIAEAWAAGSAGGATTEHRMDLRLAASHAVRSSARAVDLMYGAGGGTSVYRRSVLQRHFRDVHVATQHMMVSDSTLELVGRLLLGVPTDVTML